MEALTFAMGWPEMMPAARSMLAGTATPTLLGYLSLVILDAALIPPPARAPSPRWTVLGLGTGLPLGLRSTAPVTGGEVRAGADKVKFSTRE